MHTLVKAVRRGRERVRWQFERTPLWDARNERRQRQALAEWARGPRQGSPPHLVKQWIVKESARRHAVTTLIETGTLYGDMIQGTRSVFRRIVSIELAPHFARRAQQRFAPDARVRILEGDSGTIIPRVLETLEEPALFWLDAHYSADETARGELDTPIEAELRTILAHDVRTHVILIDDMRDFGKGDYPSIDDVRALVAAARPDLDVEVQDDVMRIAPRSTAH